MIPEREWMKDINKKEVQNKIIPSIIERLAREYVPEKIVLFGSYAYGNPDDDSDIDLLVVKKTSENSMERWLHVHKILIDFHSISITPFIYTPEEINNRLKLKDFFIMEIIRKGKIMYG